MLVQPRERKTRRVLQSDIQPKYRLRLAVVAKQSVLGDVGVDQVDLRAERNVLVEVPAADRVEVAGAEPKLAQNAPPVVPSSRPDLDLAGRTVLERRGDSLRVLDRGQRARHDRRPATGTSEASTNAGMSLQPLTPARSAQRLAQRLTERAWDLQPRTVTETATVTYNPRLLAALARPGNAQAR